MGELCDPNSPRWKIAVIPEAGMEYLEIFFLYPTLFLLLLKCYVVLLHYTDLGDMPDT